MKTMFVTKFKGVLAVVLVAGVFLAGAAGLPYQARAAGQPAQEGQPAAKKDQRKGLVKPDPEADKLVRQLGSESFAQREAAHRKAREWLAKYGKGKPRPQP
jgi:hypothetical protein